MSLTRQQQIDTIKEFSANLELLDISKSEIADALNTNSETIEEILNLKVKTIEAPWILKNYLETQLNNKGIKSIPFSALKGDYHDYWFLDSQKIELGRL